MSDDLLPNSLGEEVPNLIPRALEEDLCQRLDEFYDASNISSSVMPSTIFRGALVAMRPEFANSNPDWIPQVAHSLREILYQFDTHYTSPDPGVNGREKALTDYGTTYNDKRLTQQIGQYHNLITEIAHHNFSGAGQSSLLGGSVATPVHINRAVFEPLVFSFSKLLYAVLRRQLDAHAEIDDIFTHELESLNSTSISELVELNMDAKQYFFSKAPANWIDWLSRNSFLDSIGSKAVNSNGYSYSMPELSYLFRVTNHNPADVVAVMLRVAISEDSFNPEVLDQFSRICSILPANQLARVVQKMRDEKWIVLMRSFNSWGVDYGKMLETLANAKEFEALFVLSEAILMIQEREEVVKDEDDVFANTDNPFYFNDLSYTRVFEHLASVDDLWLEDAYALSIGTLAKIAALGAKNDGEEAFEISDSFSLFDVDFFTLGLGDKAHISYRDDVRELAAVVKVLSDKLIGVRCTADREVREIFDKHIQRLPDTRAMWRLKLYIMSLCPKVFAGELKDAFFRLFTTKHYYDLTTGTEYELALRKAFSVLSEKDKRQYVASLIELCAKEISDAKEQEWQRRFGSMILSMIQEYLTVDEINLIKSKGFTLDAGYQPKPSIESDGMEGGSINPRGEVTQTEFGTLPIARIAAQLREDWIPKKLVEQNSHDDFRNPLNATGVSDQLKADIAKRLSDYLENAELFFERGVLDEHYTYAYLQGIYDCMRSENIVLDGINWDKLIAVCIEIVHSGELAPFGARQRGRDLFEGWLSSWTGVLLVLADLLRALLNERIIKAGFNFSNKRAQLFDILAYLLRYPDPTPADEELETAKSKMKLQSSDDYVVSDPFTMGLNSVRGRAFQALTFFVYQDGKQFAQESTVKISDDVKVLYRTVLETENTRAIMFMFGHYLPSFYYRDKAWMLELLPVIFPIADEKNRFYTAAWEGFLANNLFEEIFFEPAFQELYTRGLQLEIDPALKQKRFKDMDEGIATHLALAFMHYDAFEFEHSLFKALWDTPANINIQAKFVSFVGRSFISGRNAKADELLVRNPISKQKIIDFWDWVLDKFDNAQLFIEFGFWIDLEKGIFEAKWLAEHVRSTLEKTQGGLGWEMGLIDSIVQFAKEAPEDCLESIRLYLLVGGVIQKSHRIPFYIAEEWQEAFRILYVNQSTKQGVYNLIDDLIREGHSVFWPLKNIVDETKSV